MFYAFAGRRNSPRLAMMASTMTTLPRGWVRVMDSPRSSTPADDADDGRHVGHRRGRRGAPIAHEGGVPQVGQARSDAAEEQHADGDPPRHVAPVAAIGVRASMTTAASETCTAATLADGRASGVTKRRR